MISIPKYHNEVLKRHLLLLCLFEIMQILPSYGQHNVHIKTNVLDQSAQGAPISGVVVSKDQGDVVQVTDANGEAVLTDVNGTMSIRALHPDYKEFTQTFTINSDTTLYFAMPLTHRVGPWGVDDLNADWWKAIYRTATSSHDPTKWDHLLPVYTRIEGASIADSLNIIAAMNAMSTSTGYNLFSVISPTITKDTTFTIYMNASNNFSEISPDINWIAVEGYSKISQSDIPRITHEIVKSQDGWPTDAIPVPTNANTSMQDRPPWQPIDGSYLSLKLEQDFRKKGGRQHLFIGNMQNYIALSNVGIVSITSPLNNAVDVDTLLNILGTKDANAIWYDFKITTDDLGNNIVMAQNGVDRPRIYTDLEPGKTYFLFGRARNNTSTGSWPTPVKITTKALIVTGLEKINSEFDISIFPNPTNSILNILLSPETNSGFNIMIYDLSGQLKKSELIKNADVLNRIKLDLGNLKPGLYFISISDSETNRLLGTKKIIINHGI